MSLVGRNFALLQKSISVGGGLGAPGHWELELRGFLLSQAIHSGMPLKENGALVVPSTNGYGEAMMFVRCLVSPQCDASPRLCRLTTASCLYAQVAPDAGLWILNWVRRRAEANPDFSGICFLNLNVELFLELSPVYLHFSTYPEASCIECEQFSLCGTHS